MKKIGIDEFFLISEIADKMDLEPPKFDIIKAPEFLDDLKKVKNPDHKSETDKVNKEFGLKMFTVLIKKAYKAKDEIKQLISAITGKDPNSMTAKELIDTFKNILKQDGVMESFKSADS